MDVCNIVDENLSSFKDFITVKAHTNFSIASYLEEFPGLVHFIHVDRSNNRVTAPNIEMTCEDNMINLRKKVILQKIRVHTEEKTTWKLHQDTIGGENSL